ncbi:myelin regulatory factor [Trichonephila clavipes]|uniref:Myelin regulatory factor n=1 Tax=Trichonephila clavipes TaxID=2585209 RepID=A0A8X6UYV5_TRICX|nr:myelin regulatory factor [Trichonephila clavipes]
MLPEEQLFYWGVEKARMLSGRGDLGTIDSETFDFSQLEEYINDDNESNIYFHDALVTSSDLKLSEEKAPPYARSGQPGLVKEPAHSPQTAPQHQKNFRPSSDVTSSFNKPHHLPDSPPDSGSEPPFSPPNEDPKLKCPSLELIHHHLPSEMSVHPSENLKQQPQHHHHHYIHYGMPQKHATDVSISSSTSPTSPHHPVSPVHSTHSASMPVLAQPSMSGLTQIPTFVPNTLPLLTSGLGHLYTGCQVIYSQFGLAIHQNDHQARRRFIEWVQNEIAVVPDFHKRILFSDEAHFWLNGYVNKQNCRIWSEANPYKCHNVTVNGDQYRAMITNFFIPELNNHDVQELWFQQDGATCHTARATIDLLKDTLGDRLISRFGPVNWPPRSCDLTPLDYFLWGYVKALVYADKPQMLDYLEDNIRRVIADIRPQMLEEVIENWTSRLDYIQASHGSPMPEIIFKMSEEFLYENITNPVSSTTNSKKRKLPESPKIPRTHQNGNGVQVKIEPSIQSPDPTTTVLPSSDDDYNFELSAAEANALFVDSSFQCIRFQSFQPNTWAQLLDKDMKEIASPNFRVDADKGFNYSNADESFVCQKKNHFQVTVHVQPVAEAHYVRTPEGTRVIEKFSLNFHGVKMESPTQTIKVEQSQSDRSKRPFHPVPLELVTDQVTKTTVGRLHFSETTSNNMRKKGKPNPDQRFFFLVVSLCAHVSGEPPITIIAHSSEKIIVRASNPGQFENDMELSWQKGHTLDSIFHNVSEKIAFRYS